METWDYRTFKLTVEAAADPATYDMLGNEGWELCGLAPITERMREEWGTSWVLAVFKRSRMQQSPHN